MKSLAIYKLAKVDEATDRLEAALVRLETALGAHPDVRFKGGEEARRATEKLKQDFNTAKTENDTLRSVNRDITSRLDNAIGRVQKLLEA